MSPIPEAHFNMNSTRTFGHVRNVTVGTIFSSRKLLSQAGVHRPLVAGICGGADGAESVVVSGGYEDDKDFGDEVIYTGQGGSSAQGGGIQVADQQWLRGNAALAWNCVEGVSVRLVRGAHRASAFGPANGFRYDGLYRVDRFWEEIGARGFKICRFRLMRNDLEDRPDNEPARPHASANIPVGALTSATNITLRRGQIVQRIIRSSAVALRIKQLHDHRCQMCGLRLMTPGGPYAEAAHIRALGFPHNGPDSEDNILCLCPNHHVLFDYGRIVINDDFTISEGLGGLRLHARHSISREHLTYHRHCAIGQLPL